jgi:hypothetical protein
MDPYPEVATSGPAVATALTQAAFKKAVRAAAVGGQGTILVATMGSSLAVKIMGPYPSEASARLAFEGIKRSPSGAVYVGIFVRDGDTWREVDTDKIEARPFNWQAPVLATLGGLGVLWLATKPATKASGAKRRKR